MQPYFFPYIGYFQLIAQCDLFIIQDTVQYIKGGWINRNRILNNKGEAIWITRPVAAADHWLEIREREYHLHQENARRLMRRIENAYFRAPNFASTIPLVEAIMTFDDSNVAAFNTNLLHSVSNWLGLKTCFLRSSELPISPELKGQARVLEQCRHVGATRYINPANGRDLYQIDEFRRHAISLSFLETTVEPRKDIHPYLSIIHTLMTESDSAITGLMGRYKLVPG